MKPDFEYYALEFKGAEIPNEKAFDAAAVEATAFVDSIVSNREYISVGDNLSKYRNAICAVAEEIYKQITYDEGQQKQSESVGNHSVSYSSGAKSSAEREQTKHRKARMYLAGTGLLYRGLH